MSVANAPVDLLICVKCRIASADEQTDTTLPEDKRPGRELCDRLLSGQQPDGLRIRAVECLSNCSRGCSMALRGGRRWSYVYGNLRPEDSEMILDGSLKYLGTEDGLVPWRERPEHFRKNCIARIPPLEN